MTTEPNIRERLERAACFARSESQSSNPICGCRRLAECDSSVAVQYGDQVAAICAEQAAIRAEQREADQRSTEQRVLDDLGQSQPDWAKDILDGGK